MSGFVKFSLASTPEALKIDKLAFFRKKSFEERPFDNPAGSADELGRVEIGIGRGEEKNMEIC